MITAWIDPILIWLGLGMTDLLLIILIIIFAIRG